MILIHFRPARTQISGQRRFQAPWERREGATHASQLEFACLVFSLIVIQSRMCDHRAQNLLVLTSPQLCYVQTVTFVRAWICTDDTRTSRLKAKGRWSYLSQNIGPEVAGSADLLRRPYFAVQKVLLHSCVHFLLAIFNGEAGICMQAAWVTPSPRHQ